LLRLLLRLLPRSQCAQVTFLYPSRPNQTILKGLNLTLPAQKLTCIMGPSGCGKSTVMSMLMRLYEPLTGKITLDGVDISRINVQFLRSIIGLVQQEPVRCMFFAPAAGARTCPLTLLAQILFSWSLRDNLKYGKPDATEEARSLLQIALRCVA
jgi:ABC-type multidrug transport system fused ATPase/permease subunit